MYPIQYVQKYSSKNGPQISLVQFAYCTTQVYCKMSVISFSEVGKIFRLKLVGSNKLLGDFNTAIMQVWYD